MEVIGINGEHYRRVSDACAAYGVNTSTFYDRIRRGYSIIDALTRECKNGSCGVKVKAPNGKVYNSIAAMCSDYGVGYACYKYRVDKGMSMEEALTATGKSKCMDKSEKDHLGNVYKNRRSMCDAYGLTIAVYHRRRRSGMTLEEALTASKEEADRKMHEYRLSAVG